MFSHNKNEVVTPLSAVARAKEILDLFREKKIPVVYIPGNAGRIGWLETLFFTDANFLTGGEKTYVFQTLALGDPKGWAKAVTHGVIPVTPFIGSGVRALVNDGLALNIRSHLSQVHKLFENDWRPDVAFAHVSPPDVQNRVTLGLNAGLDISAVKNATFKIAVVNSNIPRWAIGEHFDPRHPESPRMVEYGCAMKLEDFDLIVYEDEPLLEHKMLPKGSDTRPSIAIANNIINVLSKGVEDLSILPYKLQLGIGTIPNALAEMMATRGRSVAAVWSEMFSDGVLRLYKEGLIRSLKIVGPRCLRDHIVVGFVLGSKELYEIMHDNHDFAVLPQEIVNDPVMIKRNDHMASINATLAVSLHGQVAASTIGTKHHSDVGGQYDFALGATWSEGGIAIIALPSTVMTKDGVRESRVVALHAEGAHHTIGADLPVVVITEHGVADLRYRSDPKRVEEMLNNVVHPDWVVPLSKEMRRIPAMQGVGVIPPRIVLLKSGKQATVRPATSLDIPAIRTYLRSQTLEDRQNRYMGTLSINYLTSEERMNDWYVHTLDFVGHAAFVAESQGAIIGVAHAFRSKDEQGYEVAFSRLSGREGEGIGYHLMTTLLDWAKENNVERFHATTYKSNARMRKLFTRFGFTASPNADFLAINYSGMITNLAETHKR